MATRRSEDKPSRRQAPDLPAAEATPVPRASRARRAASSAPASAKQVPKAAAAAPRRARARPPAPPATESPSACASTTDESAKADSFWRAGLRALDNVRHDVQRRQASVIETLLGIPPAATGAEPRLNLPGLPGLPGLDAFGLRKFEDVFDQRVAAALERLGMPTRDELQALHDKLDLVLAQLERLGELAQAQAADPDEAVKPARRAPRTRSPR